MKTILKPIASIIYWTGTILYWFVAIATVALLLLLLVIALFSPHTWSQVIKVIIPFAGCVALIGLLSWATAYREDNP